MRCPPAYGNLTRGFINAIISGCQGKAAVDRRAYNMPLNNPISNSDLIQPGLINYTEEKSFKHKY